MTSGRLAGRVAIVSGAARGMGAAHVHRLWSEGAQVMATDVLEAEGTSMTRELGDGVAFCSHDVTEQGEWAKVVERTVHAFGRVDILVNNAGVARRTAIIDLEVGEFLEVIRVNQLGVFLGIRATAPVMAATGGGSIINVSSVEGMAATAGLISYVASKFAVRGMTKVAALEFGPLGIRVNSIHPGAVDTPMIRPPGREAVDYDERFRYLPIPRCGRPEDVSAAVAFLASEDAAYITGTELVIDGGMLASVGSSSPRS